jgi:toxin ParE1/3/4
VARIVWAEPALSDLNDIAEYIALDKAHAAEHLVRNVFSVVKRLEQFPDSGRRSPELLESEYREVIVGPCRIFYRTASEEVFIVYVMRGERKLRKFMIDERAKSSS